MGDFPDYTLADISSLFYRAIPNGIVLSVVITIIVPVVPSQPANMELEYLGTL